MELFKAENCAPCSNLSQWMESQNIEVPTTTLTFEKLREGEFPFKTVPSLVLDDGSVVSGFPQIRLHLSKRGTNGQ